MLASTPSEVAMAVKTFPGEVGGRDAARRVTAVKPSDEGDWMIDMLDRNG